ncbi:MAG: NACHT domain-containing protein [Anaerolineales bacterium]|nr:NACHT domain-containing protein [Anaerolineales bacterium]
MKLKLSWRFLLQLFSLLAFLISIIWIIREPKFDSFSALFTGIAGFIASFATSDSPILAPKNNRQKMLEKVNAIWITGVLDKALQGTNPLQLQLKYEPDSVKSGPEWIKNSISYNDENIFLEESSLKLFEQAGRELLVLGKPGTGKTTFLLKLLKDLITLALANEKQPIPIVLYLSSWSKSRKAIKDWIADELSEKYLIPINICNQWVNGNELLLLLDDLDEVQDQFRNDCIVAINEFKKDHMVDIVICSRADEYQLSNTKLGLSKAIAIQQLSYKEIDSYLSLFSEEFLPLRKSLYYDSSLRELITTPLMLRIAMRANKIISDTSSVKGNLKREQIINLYVTQILGEKRADVDIRPKELHRFLSWLSRQLIARDQSIFLLEQLQDDWLNTPSQKKIYYFITIGFGACAGIIASFFGTLLSIITGWANWVLTAPPFILIGGILGAILLITNLRVKIIPVEKLVWKLRWSWKAARKGMINGIILGLFGCIGLVAFVAFINNAREETFETQVISLLGTIIFAILISVAVSIFLGFIGAITGGISYKWMLTGITLGIVGGVFTTIYAGFVGFYILRYFDPEGMDNAMDAFLIIITLNGLLQGFIKGLIFGLLGGVVGAVVHGLKGSDMDTKIIQNQGIYYSTKNAIIVWLFVLLSIGAIGGLITMPVSEAIILGNLGELEFPIALGFGSLFGLIVAMQFGGYAAIKHYALRLTIENGKTLPTGIIKLLNNAVKLNLVHKVGGGFMFTHRLIMEYFANQGKKVQFETKRS